MDFGDFKLYNLCIERLKHQIARARAASPDGQGGMWVLESYCTGDPEEIIDIMELYDLKDRSLGAVMGKLAELASDASMFVGEKISFAFNADGELCIYLVMSAPAVKNTSGANMPASVIILN